MARISWVVVVALLMAGCGEEAGDGAALDESSASLATTLAPLADTYVRDGASAGTSFGSSTTLAVKKGPSGYNRESYLRSLRAVAPG